MGIFLNSASFLQMQHSSACVTDPYSIYTKNFPLRRILDEILTEKYFGPLLLWSLHWIAVNESYISIFI